MRTLPPDSSVEVSDLTSQGDLGSSDHPSSTHLCYGSSVLLLLSAWLLSRKPARRTAGHSFRRFMRPLRRIGTQLVRCDKLTGSGVRARSWIPELTSKAHERPIPESC
jgi:hypothetical protein